MFFLFRKGKSRFVLLIKVWGIWVKQFCCYDVCSLKEKMALKGNVTLLETKTKSFHADFLQSTLLKTLPFCLKIICLKNSWQNDGCLSTIFVVKRCLNYLQKCISIEHRWILYWNIAKSLHGTYALHLTIASMKYFFHTILLHERINVI